MIRISVCESKGKGINKPELVLMGVNAEHVPPEGDEIRVKGVHYKIVDRRWLFDLGTTEVQLFVEKTKAK